MWSEISMTTHFEVIEFPTYLFWIFKAQVLNDD